MGGERNAKVVAFGKLTGDEIWRAMPSDSEPGYSQPIIVTVGNTRQLIMPTTDPGNRRERGAVNWSHPAYANRHIYARNDEEIIAASLAAK